MKKQNFQPNKVSNDMNCVLELCFFKTKTINEKNRNILQLNQEKESLNKKIENKIELEMRMKGFSYGNYEDKIGIFYDPKG